MATLGDLNIVIGANIDAFEAAMNEVQRGVGRLADGLKTAGQSLTTYVTLPLAALATGAVLAFGKLESLQKGLNAITTRELGEQGVTGLAAVGQAATQTAARLEELREIAKAPGIGFEQAVQGDIRLRAVGVSAEQSAKVLKEFANAIALTGGGAADLDRVTVQLGQLAAKGKVLSQDLRPIIEAAPSVGAALKNLFGSVDSEEISKQLEKAGKSSVDFIDQLTNELAKTPRVAGGLSNAFENLGQTATQSLAQVGEAISKALNLPALLERISKAIEDAGNAFASLDPGTQKLIIGLGGVVAAAGPVLFAVGSIGAALPAITAGFSALGITSVAALGPILPIAAAVAAAAYLIIDNWGAVTAYFGPSGEGGRLFGDLAESVTNSVKQIGEAFGGLGKLGSNNLGGLVSASGIFSDLFRGIAVGLRSLSDVIGGLIGAIVNLFKGQFSEAASQAGRALLGLIDPLTNLFGFTRQAERSTTTFGEFFKEIITQSEAAKESIDLLAGGDIAGSQRTIGVLAELREQLKLLKQEREDALTDDAAKAFNPQIADVEKQIAALEGSTKKGKDALGDLVKALADNGRQSVALGADYDYLGNQQKIVENGLKSLIAAGYDPVGATVGKYVAKLRELNMVLGDNELLTLRAAKNVPELFKTPEFKLQTPEKVELPEVAEPEYSTAFSKAARQVIEGNGALQSAFTEADAANLARLVKFQKTAEEFSAGLNEILVNGLTDVAVGFGEAIGQIISGASGLEALPAIVLGALGGLAIQVGQLAIGTGIAVAGIKAALESLNPVLAIAGGIALVALGTAVKGIASNIGRSSGSGGGAGASLASSPRTSLGSNGSSNKSQIEIVAEFKLRGKDLIAISRSDDYRSVRTS